MGSNNTPPLCARFKVQERVGEKTGSDERASADGETLTRDRSASVAKLSSESSPVAGCQEWRMLICESNLHGVYFYKHTY